MGACNDTLFSGSNAGPNAFDLIDPHSISPFASQPAPVNRQALHCAARHLRDRVAALCFAARTTPDDDQLTVAAWATRRTTPTELRE